METCRKLLEGWCLAWGLNSNLQIKYLLWKIFLKPRYFIAEGADSEIPKICGWQGQKKVLEILEFWLCLCIISAFLCNSCWLSSLICSQYSHSIRFFIILSVTYNITFLTLNSLFFSLRLKKIPKRRFSKLSNSLMMMKLEKSPSKTSNVWPKSWGRTSQMRSCRFGPGGFGIFVLVGREEFLQSGDFEVGFGNAVMQLQLCGVAVMCSKHFL